MIDLSRIRNIGIVAHIDAGKTTTTERILYYTGRTHRMGEVDEGTTVTDFDEEEQQRGITIYSAAVSCPWRDHLIQLIDTPGHVDFTAEVERSLRVLDGAVIVFDAREGVEAQSETVWRQADKYGVPRICFINKMDKVGADFPAAVESIRHRLHARPVPVQWPIGAEDDFEGIIDLVTMQAVYYEVQKLGSTFQERPIPDHLLELAERGRHDLIEALADVSDTLAEKYLSDQPVTESDIRSALRAATLHSRLQPVFCGSALRYIGVQRLLDGVIDYLPSPLDMPPVRGRRSLRDDTEVLRHPDPAEPLCAYLFKTVVEKPVDLHFVRIYSGTLRSGSRILNSVREKKENVTRIYRMFARKREQIDEARAGDIVAITGPKFSLTGDTLCDPKNPIVLPHIEFAPTVITMAIEPRSSADRDRLNDALQALARQDPTFQYRFDPDTGQTVISGMGELHLEVLTRRLMRDMNVPVRVGRPRVAYRETISAPGTGEGRFVRQIGGRMHFAVVQIGVEPHQPEHGSASVTFTSALPPDALEARFLQAIEAGVRAASQSGVLGGYPLLNVKATLLDAEQHETESSEIAFESAAMIAFEQALRAAGPVLMEPIMKLEVVTPESYFGPISSDLNSRRAVITDTHVRGDYRIIHAEVPLAEMFGYANTLRSLSQGRASSTMELSHYAVVPAYVADNVLASMY